MNKIIQTKVNSETVEAMRKKLKKEGWKSAHYWTRHGADVDLLRKMARASQLNAKLLVNGFTTTWYYHESDVPKIVAGLK